MNVDKLRLDDAQHYLERMILELQGLSADRRGPLMAVLEHLAEYIRSTRNEIFALRGTQGAGLSLNSATGELEEIVGETARAANEIMDAAETVERLAAQAPEAIAAGLLGAVTRIFEASAFQDITGQRIGKAVQALQQIERNISALVQACCADIGTGPVDPRKGDEALLNGPQLAALANSQSDIDLLFLELG
jgi:chemotaxis protein CheZ